MQPEWIDQQTESFEFPNQAAEIQPTIYVKGEGPPIVILQELPGIGHETFDLADRLIAAGFRVYLPHLFGELGKTLKSKLANAGRLWCIRREFQAFRVGKQSEIASWLRALCAEVEKREDGVRIGVIGMCLTGSFAIPLMAEDAVAGAVASQPALPFKIKTDQLPMSGCDVKRARRKMEEKGPALAMRYKSDKLSTEKHIKALEDAFGNTLEVEWYCNPKGVEGALHSLLTVDFSEEAYARVEEYFKARFGME